MEALVKGGRAMRNRNYPNEHDYEVKVVDPVTREAFVPKELPLANPADSNYVEDFYADIAASDYAVPSAFNSTLERA